MRQRERSTKTVWSQKNECSSRRVICNSHIERNDKEKRSFWKNSPRKELQQCGVLLVFTCWIPNWHVIGKPTEKSIRPTSNLGTPQSKHPLPWNLFLSLSLFYSNTKKFENFVFSLIKSVSGAKTKTRTRENLSLRPFFSFSTRRDASVIEDQRFIDAKRDEIQCNGEGAFVDKHRGHAKIINPAIF